ncbi:helix-turn-helix transcriptional regulator [Paenibacillus sp. FSL R5-0527]|uniref:XRE family transcriptional regulator n=1 Tax=Paenibacillus oralis TaxID=2490856 RepID=A0A3P3TWE3_9BACL|nr:helix-turn-helix transcriptional regulator [Paenibacillus oralis]OMG45667.1 hypothetical protein BK140_31030 [Paenibacillus macerans]RRJ62451.1 XRE family transcriptional regulator [Paenibacillus oralis]
MKEIKLSENLKRIREERGVSQEELAIIIGVEKKDIGCWEDGKKEPRMGNVQKLAEALGVTITDLIF